MDLNTSFAPPNLFSEYFPPTDTVPLGITVDAQATDPWKTQDSNPRAAPPGGDVKQDFGIQGTSHIQDRDRNRVRNNDNAAPISVDLADEIKGMYRLLDLISESGSNGYGKDPSRLRRDDFTTLIRYIVDKVIIAQDSLQRFINAMSPGAYASIIKVDFKTLDRLAIKPLGIYGCKDEIVRLLQSLGAVDKKLARLLLAPSDIGSSQRTLSSGLYILKGSAIRPTDERHYVIYWPEDSTWNDSAASSVSRNRVTFMRYLTKMCDQVVALLSPDHSASIVWSDEDSDTESVDIDAGDSGRLFTFEVAKTNEQEESAVSRPGFQMNSRIIVPYEVPPDCQVDPSIFVPRLLPGETVQGLLTAVYIPHQVRTATISQGSYSRVALSQLLRNNALVLSDDLDEDTVQSLVNVALSDLFPEQCKDWRAMKQDIRDVFMREQTKRKSAVAQNIASTEGSLRRALREEVVDHVISLFPSLDREGLSSRVRVRGNAKQGVENSVRLSDVRTLYPTFESIFQKHVKDAKFDGVLKKSLDFKALKLDVVSLWHLQERHGSLDPETRSALVQALLVEHNIQRALQLLEETDGNTNGPSVVTRLFSYWTGSRGEESFKNQMKTTAANLPDSRFLKRLESADDKDLRSTVQNAKALAQRELSYSIDTAANKMTHAVLAMQQDNCRMFVQLEVENEERKVLADALVEFIREINKKSAGRRNSTVYLDRIDVEKEKYRIADYKVTGRWEAPQLPQIKLWVHLMDLTSDDRQNMQLNTKHIPTPTINDRFSSSFHLPPWAELAFYRLLENKKLLLVLASRDKFFIFLERLSVLDMAIQRGKSIKSLNRDKLGQRVLFSFDESKRVLAVCASTRLQLHVFVFDESFKTLQGQGSAINLASWYSLAEISILQMTFVCGGEEVALVDSNAQVRIFSFVTLQFRPASIQLQTPPNAIYSSPDGSCLFVLHTHDSGPSLTAYHWETFGSTGGIALDVPEFPLEGAVLTSMVSRGRVFFLGLDTNSQAVKSVVIDITKKVTEFMFKEKGSKYASNSGTRHTQHNSLLDCHAEVWTRFPVLAAVRRRTITSLSERRQKTLTFITDHHTRPFASYFSDLIHTFEKTTRKPTGDELRGIQVSATQFRPFWDTVFLESDWKVSRYRVGEWLVDLLCLIPIHIAVCRENRFVPLANGVLSAELERSLLGAEVNQIVDRLSFGWYESIFQSYLALKPVKVVSSMGQQSVGKSFSLNHLVDTSFAGSAMRTTEGVWMSVTPTDEALIVALDFEGVDSVERSPQEDTLLVLFNTAISNLVLFRNNFAFSRDISGLFQSFQSSSSVLDPAANPTLFQSTLVIIIKDVVEADKIEITREFSLKFQQIVQQEQDANFISRLHGGKLDIIPWPVIESRDFYKLFGTLKKRLDLQKISHPAAGEFLYTIKTLMAKLKANDWGALSHTMAEHRAKSLSALLTFALSTGYSEIDPDFEPLKNFDTDLAVECDDTTARFAISDREQLPPNEIEMYHSALLESRKSGMPRQFIPDSEWIGELASHLNGLIDLRVNHVQHWLDSNLERFQGGHAAIEDLRRRFDSLIIEMKTNVQLCRAQCASCHLLCVRSRLHEGEHSCQTTHKCVHNCEFCGDSTKLCGLAAGHPGKHVAIQVSHVFTLDPGSMKSGDRRPLPDAPATDRIREKANNRLGAVYSALYSFWSARHAAVNSGQQAIGARRDAYSIILFDDTAKNAVVNDFTSTPDQLLDSVLNERAKRRHKLHSSNTSQQSYHDRQLEHRKTGNPRYKIRPSWIFVAPQFSMVSFGPDGDSSSNMPAAVLAHAFFGRNSFSSRKSSSNRNSSASTLRNMVHIALEIQNRAPPDPLLPAAARIPSSFNTALDTYGHAWDVVSDAASPEVSNEIDGFRPAFPVLFFLSLRLRRSLFDMSDSGSGSERSEPSDVGASLPEPPQKDSGKYISPWVPVSMLVVTTAALAVPLVLLRRQRARSSALSKSVSSPMVTSAPPVRRAPNRGVPSAAAPPRAAPALMPASTKATPSVESSSLQRSSGAPSGVAKEDGFNSALFSLKAFAIATAFVVTGGAASVWGVKTYLGVRDTQEFASAMRLTLLTKWPLLASRIHRASDSAPLPPPISLPVMITPTSEPNADPPPPPTAVPEADGWTWSAAQARLAAAYEHGGVARFAETAVGELEAEAELERRKRGLAASSQARTRS
ncbi:hypothetical protein BJY52DRAFT_1189313 [Lactarius psammicola]|nr:hypothetical protein BJY52DRAFT_1189313 [Lactarius psammicola]